jgi:hypothetical protein
LALQAPSYLQIVPGHLAFHSISASGCAWSCRCYSCRMGCMLLAVAVSRSLSALAAPRTIISPLWTSTAWGYARHH